jgi:hypothetical protein
MLQSTSHRKRVMNRVPYIVPYSFNCCSSCACVLTFGKTGCGGDWLGASLAWLAKLEITDKELSTPGRERHFAAFFAPRGVRVATA